MHRFNPRTLLSLCLCASLLVAFDRPTACFTDRVLADDFPQIYNNERDETATPMAAAQAAASLQLPEEFRATVFASEPTVQNPIAVAWDQRGRLWVAENYTYSDRNQRFDLKLRDRVIVLHDTDQDGVADDRVVFTDQVQMLTSVEVGHGGVWLMCPPRLLFIPDANGDAVPDGPARTILDGFTVAQSNYHNFANGLRWGPDGWLYGRCGHSCPGQLGRPGTPDEQRIPIDGGMWRYHPTRQVVEVLCHGTVNPWGHDWNAMGELFYINTVIGHVWHVIPGSHFDESFGESLNPDVHERLNTIADHYHFDTSGSWTESRGGAANDYGGGHAHVGMMIYQGGVWPERYDGRLFTVNMHGMRVNVERLERDGAGYSARHEPDFVISRDPFFRAIEVTTGPDGNAYLVDWSDTGECHEHTGVHRNSGRIYKIIAKQNTATRPPLTRLAKPACLSGTGPLPQLWKDYQSGQTTDVQLRQLLSHSDEHVRVWAIRLLTDFWPLDTVVGPSPNVTYPAAPETKAELLRMAQEDKAGMVQLTLASTLQRLPVAERVAMATAIVKHDEFANDRDLPNLVWYGLIPVADETPEMLAMIAAETNWPKLKRWVSRSLAMRHKEHPMAIDRLLTLACDFDVDGQTQVAIGMLEAFEGLRRVPAPVAWKEFANAAESAELKDRLRTLSVYFGDGRAIAELVAVANDRQASIQTRKQALASLIEARPKRLRDICLALLPVRDLNLTAAQGLALYKDAKIGQQLAKSYRRFHPKDREGLMGLLVSRPNFANALLDHIESGQIDAKELSPFHARQIQSLNSARLNRRLAEVWGELRPSDKARKAKIKSYKQLLTPEAIADANLSQGRVHFQRQCAQCHRLYGAGEAIGPDLTGAQRNSLDYLLENLLDPSAVVGKDHRMQIVETSDGRIFNGLIVSRNDQRLVLRTATAEVVLPAEDLESVTTTQLSPMPDGLLDPLSKKEVVDLIGYLMHPHQVALPSNSR